MDKTNDNPDTPRNIKKLTLPDGLRVGIVNLDKILYEVVEMKLVDDNAIKTELLRKASAYNYIPSSGETDYSIALFEQYRIKIGKIEAVKDKSHVHKPGG